MTIIEWFLKKKMFFSNVFVHLSAPVVFAVQVNGSGYASDIFRDIVASFDILQRGNITVLSKKCLVKPFEPDFMRYMLIGTAIIKTCAFVYISTKMQKYHPFSTCSVLQ